MRERIKLDCIIRTKCFFSILLSVNKLFNFFGMYCRELLKRDSVRGCMLHLGSQHIHPVATLLKQEAEHVQVVTKAVFASFL